MIRNVQIAIIIFCLFLSISMAQDFIPQKTFVNFSIEKGIPYPSIEGIHFDSYGNLWFLGSNNQIYYFDGRSYFSVPLHFSDSINVLNSFLPVDSGLIVSTQKGIFCVQDAFSSQPEEIKLSFLPEGEYTKIVKKDSLFFAINMDSNQVVLFSLNKLLFKRGFDKPLRYLLIHDSLLAISTDRNSILILKLQNNQPTYVHEIRLDFLDKLYYIEPMIIANGQLYILINEYGIVSIKNFFSSNFQIHSYKKFFPQDVNLHYILFTDMQDNTFWTGGFYEGLYHWIPEKGIVQRITEKNGLGNNLIRFILEDQYNRLWFGTQNGISVLKNKYVTVFNKNSGLGNEFIWGVTKINNEIFICTNSGIYILQKKEGHFRITNSEIFAPLQNISLNFIQKTSEGVLLSSAEKYGLYKIENNRLISLKKMLKEKDCRLVSYIYEDSKRRVWLGGYDIGYIQNGKYYHYKTLPFSSDLKNRNIVYDIVESPKTGTIYFAATDGLYSFRDGKMRYHFAPYKYQSIYAQIEYDPWTEKILIGTEGKGVIAFDENREEFSRSIYDSLVNGRNVYNIVRMDTILLISTNIGLTAISQSRKHVWYINSSNGLLSNETNSFSLTFDKDYIYLGTTNGLHILTNDFSKYKPYSGGIIYVKEISTQGEKIKYHRGKENKIILPSSIKSLKIKLGYASFFDYSPPKLKYTFSPYFESAKISDSWEIEFYNLPYGSNELIMEAVNSENEVVSNNRIRLIIQHTVPFYYSYKFYIFLIIGLIIFVVGIVKFRTYRLEQISMKLKNEVLLQFEEIQYLNDLLEKIIQKGQLGVLLFDSNGTLAKSNEIANQFIDKLFPQIESIHREDLEFNLHFRINKNLTNILMIWGLFPLIGTNGM